ncbi:hypothetical protein MNBD_GAMMA21-2433 [hydrothermal vent metagenome]|uniref:Uncharacterized protein n=1 Tax=hydrothermal vent metagenome TaxID=652676 RepID=A0A3B1B0M3_9ZZZZ
MFKEGDRLFPYPAPVTGIILGLKMPQEHKDSIVEIVSNKVGVKLYQSERKPDAFALEINEIDL